MVRARAVSTAQRQVDQWASRERRTDSEESRRSSSVALHLRKSTNCPLATECAPLVTPGPWSEQLGDWPTLAYLPPIWLCSHAAQRPLAHSRKAWVPGHTSFPFTLTATPFTGTHVPFFCCDAQLFANVRPPQFLVFLHPWSSSPLQITGMVVIILHQIEPQQGGESKSFLISCSVMKRRLSRRLPSDLDREMERIRIKGEEVKAMSIGRNGDWFLRTDTRYGTFPPTPDPALPSVLG